MLSAHAYSFRQKSKLAVSLSWIGGFTNVVSLLAMGTLVSHVTGSVTQLGRSIGTNDIDNAIFTVFLVVTFTLGAVLSALLTETARRRGWRSKYILPMGLEAILLTLLVARLSSDVPATTGVILYQAAGLASLAMGLQNATITRISGSIVRTTHLTGIFTDLGLEGVQYFFWWADELAKKRRQRAGRLLQISRRHPTALRLLLLLSIAASFAMGAIVGTVAYLHWHAMSLLGCVAFLSWIVFEDWRSPMADIRELDLVNDPELKLQGLLSQLLPQEVAMYRSSSGGRSEHRAPNFQLWIDRIPKTSRVIVLAISPLTRFDANAVMDLEAAVNRLHADQRHLIISGVTTHQFKALDSLGVARMMDVHNICPDIEFAIARALAVLEEMKHPSAV
jgi:uncharacterized membrane protein YoaK (UPF0700 family)